jgi:hypothetical protein
MKTQRRHELQTNDLAEKLSSWIAAIEPYSRAITGSVIIVAAAVLLVMFIARSRERTRTAAWNEFYAATAERDPGALSELAAKHAGTPTAAWALQMAGQMNLMQGASQLYQDRTSARSTLNEAADAFDGARMQAVGKDQELIRQRAMFGLAQVKEALNELGEARNLYQQIAETWPESAIGTQALERKELLERGRIQEFYEEFQTRQPPPARPADGPQIPFGDLPSEPDLTLPGPSDLPGTATEPGSATLPGGEDLPGETDAGDVDVPPGTAGDPAADAAAPADADKPASSEPVGTEPETPSENAAEPDRSDQ